MPSVHLDPKELTACRLVLNPMCLAEGDAPPLAARLRQLLGA